MARLCFAAAIAGYAAMADLRLGGATLWLEDRGYLLLENKDQVPVSRNKKDMVQRALG